MKAAALRLERCVCGEAGIGKSTLLRYAVGRADGMAVLSGTGVESEAELPFAAVADFLRPALGHLDAPPEPQAAALAAALAPRRRGPTRRPASWKEEEAPA